MLNNFKYLYLPVTVVLFLILSCNDEDQERNKPSGSADLYFDYRIWGDEESGLMTVILRFRELDEDGDAVSLKPPSHVAFDGEKLVAGSSHMNGVFYEIRIPTEDFNGTHQITYTNAEGNAYHEEFSFRAMELKTSFSETVSRQDLQLEFSGLDSSDFVHTIMTDTSKWGREIDRVDTVRNGLLTIPGSYLDQLHDGPVFLEFYREEAWPLKEAPGAGRLSITYGIKRAFILTGGDE